MAMRSASGWPGIRRPAGSATRLAQSTSFEPRSTRRRRLDRGKKPQSLGRANVRPFCDL
jgi:hypothetical protein